MHSFSYQVKSELITAVNTKPKYKACLLGILLFCKSFSYNELCVVTENKEVADFFKSLVEKAIGENTVFCQTSPKKSSSLYTLSVERETDRKALFEYFSLEFSQSYERRITTEIIQNIREKNLPSLIAGAFLACGSIIDPNKEYHIELVIPTLDLCNDLGLVMLERFGILAKHVERKNAQVVYIKESENIEDLLTLMGATMGTLEIMNVKILKDVRNKINRAVNCDSANIEKSLRAAEKQIEDIELIDRTIGINSLTDELREIAELRYENPDFNLKDLGNSLGISRSGANHRLIKLAKIAEEIRVGTNHLEERNDNK